eukprot:853123-Lingulodinium_polyedra.AAC.1
MAALADRACGLVLLPSRSGLGSWLLNPLTGEWKEFEKPMEIFYDEEGSAYISELCEEEEEQQQSGEPQWLLHVLPKRGAFEEGGKIYIRDFEKEKTCWLEDWQKQLQPRTVQLQLGGQDKAMAVHGLASPVAGAFLLWTVRDVQAALELELAPGYSSSWIGHQWSSWLAMAADCKLPAAQLVRSS